MRKNSLPNFFFRTVAALSILLAIGAAGRLQAQTYYFPGSNYSYTGGANSWPLSAGTAGGSNMCQWLYLPADFNTTPPTGGILITTIYLKPASSGSYSYSNLSIKLGNTSLTTLTTGSWNTGLTTVYNPSSVTLSVTSGSWYAITLSTPFFYSGGGLLMEITHGNTTGIGSGTTLNQYSVTGRNGRMYGSNTSSTGTADIATALFGFDAIPAACSGTPAAGSITNAAMNPASPVCAGGTTTLNATQPNVGSGLTYSWQSGAASTGPFSNVTNGSGAATLSYTTGPVPSTTWYRMGVTCTNSSITTYSAPYQVLVGAPQPSAITGSPTSCPGDASTYSVTNVPGSTYTWTLPTGWTGSSTTSSIVATPGPTAGTISVTATSSCGTSVPRTYTVVQGSAPATPATISGNTAVCAGSIQTYTVASVTGATSYVWTLPSGWSGTSTTNSLTATTAPTAATGILSVKAVNGCGNSSNANLSINVITSLAGPGTITVSPSTTTYCSGALYNFSINPVPGATAYIWSLPTGWTGTVTGTSIQAFPGSAGGQVQVTAYASCATSTTSSLSTTVAPTLTPGVSIAANSSAICQGVPSTFTATPVNGGTAPTYIWKKNGVVVMGTNNTYTDASLVNGDLLTVLMVSNATCRSVDTISSNSLAASITPSVTPGIGINSNPVITICQGTNLNFTTTSTGGGTSPTYQWYRNNVLINGATGTTYSTNSANNGDTITVQMTTNAACAKFPVANSNKVGIVVNAIVSPTITASSTSTLPVAGVPITFTATQSGGGPTPVYQWFVNGVAVPGETATTFTTSALKDGDRVWVQMISYDPCAQPNVVTSNEVVMGNPTAVGSVRSNWDGIVNLYPNPTGGRFTIAASWNAAHADARVSIDVLNVLGQRIYHSEVAPDRAQSASKWHYDVQLGDNVPAGQYIVRLSTADGMSATLPLTLAK